MNKVNEIQEDALDDYFMQVYGAVHYEYGEPFYLEIDHAYLDKVLILFLLDKVKS